MKRLPIFVIALSLIALACKESAEIKRDQQPATVQVVAALPKNDRILAIAVSDPVNGNYDDAVTKALNAGAQALSLSVYWDEIETAPQVYNPDPNWLEIANAYYPTHDIAIILALNPIDTNQNRIPTDLKNLPLDDPAVIERFNKLQDYVFSQIPDLNLVAFSIGNEIDGYLGKDTEKWAAYTTFYAETSAHARSLRPSLMIGTKGIFDGIVSTNASHFQTLNTHSDAIFVSYYPLNSDFTVREPNTVHEDFAKIVSLYPNQEIYLLELGYPSSEICNSSESKQAAFISETFRAWDAHAEQIKMINFVWLNEISSSSIRTFESYYGFSDKGFAAYLGSLGLLNEDGSEKTAFSQLRAEAEARGWRGQ